MNNYTEWKNLKQELEEKNPYTDKFTYETGDVFYIEPVFYLKLQSFKLAYPERFNDILLEMERVVKKNHIVVFIGDDEEEISDVDNAIYLTIQDITNPLQIFVEDKSRGSDYGD